MNSKSTSSRCILYYIMRRRTQLYLEEDQYRWLKQKAGHAGSIAGVVRDLVDQARRTTVNPQDDELMRYLLDEPAAKGKRRTSVVTVDEDLYGS